MTLYDSDGSCLVFIHVTDPFTFEGTLHTPCARQKKLHFSDLEGALFLIKRLAEDIHNPMNENWFSFEQYSGRHIYLARIFVENHAWTGEIYHYRQNTNYFFTSFEEFKRILTGNIPTKKGLTAPVNNLTFWETVSCLSGFDTLSCAGRHPHMDAGILSPEDLQKIASAYI